MLTLLLYLGGLLLTAGLVYPAVCILIHRLAGDRRPLRDLLAEI